MSNNTINKEEVEKFSKIAEEWWNPNGKFKPLHKFNPIRIEYIKNNIIKDFNISSNHKPLKGASKKNIDIAKHHLKKSNLKIEYHDKSPENFNYEKKFDVILNMEIVEHVEDIPKFINQSTKFLKNNGLMFIATLNQTLKSYVFAIIGAEYILRWLPIGTHDWNKFVKPENLEDICNKNSLKLKSIDGVKFNPILNKWKLSNDKSVNYITKYKKS